MSKAALASIIHQYPKDKPLKLGVMRLSAMGDCLMLLATIQRIQRLRPHWHITWFISKVWMPLFEQVEGIDFVPMDKPRKVSDYIQFAKQWRSVQFDVFLCMQASLRSNLLYLGIRSPIKLGFDSKRAKDGHRWFVNQTIPAHEEHIFEGFERFADVLGVPRCHPDWRLPVSKTDLVAVRDMLQSLSSSDKPLESGGLDSAEMVPRQMIVLNLAASKLERTPYEAFFTSLIEELTKAFNVLIIMVGGGSQWELELARQVYEAKAPEMEAVPSQLVNWVGQTSLPQLAALISLSDMVIAPDSGPAHLANALNIPTIGLFAVAPPELTAAYNWREFAVNVYPEAVKRYLQKAPNEVKWGTRVHEREAMRLITPSMVMAQVKKLLSKGQNSSFEEGARES